MTCDRSNPCNSQIDRRAEQIAQRLDREDPIASQMLLEASNAYGPRQMNELVANVQRRERVDLGDNLEVAPDGRLLISKLDRRVEVLSIDASGNRFRQDAQSHMRGPGLYRSRQEAGVADYVQRGVVGAITGAAINGHNRGQGALQGGVGAIGGKAVREATGQEGATGVVVETLGACGVGAILGGKNGCKNGAAGSAIGQGLEWLTRKK